MTAHTPALIAERLAFIGAQLDAEAQLHRGTLAAALKRMARQSRAHHFGAYSSDPQRRGLAVVQLQDAIDLMAAAVIHRTERQLEQGAASA